jgi:hypothetical protein
MDLANWKGNLTVHEVHASPAGSQPFQLARYMYLCNWKGNLPAGEACTLPTGRKPFQPASYM